MRWILLYPVLEIYLLYKFIEAYSFLDALVIFALSALVGALIIRIQGQATLVLFQRDLAQGKIPANQILHRSLVIIGGFCLFIPGFFTDVLGLLCILPGTRHLIALYLKYMIGRGILKGRVFVSKMGRRMDNGPRTEREAQVVDIEPLEVTHQKRES